ncbi:hypothetical protein KSP40_PGU009252 [Platanthera guangdongensis]|uniref:Uncharacterized protein n=1 Tax=Platanthera guangdongensis TaxID=2320717 RepID=A0ABR2MSA3_9ASPA
MTWDVQFVVVDSSSAYNTIFGHPLQALFEAIHSIPHLALKFITPSEIGVTRGDQEVARLYYLQQAHPSQDQGQESPSKA